MIKKNVEVIARHRTDGVIIPLKIVWDDGRLFDILRIKEIKRAASMKTGGHGLRYTCLIENQERYLFLEDDYKWFIEFEKR